MQVALMVQVALVTAVGGLVAGLLAGFTAIATLDVAAGVALRTVLVTAVVMLASYLLVRRRVLTARRGELLLAGSVGLVVGYALNPFAWIGRAFFAQALRDPGVTTSTLDLLGWMAVGAVAVAVASRAAVSHRQPLGYEREA